MEVEYGMKKLELPPQDKYPEGTFSHRQDDASCSYFKGRCPVNLHQKNPEEDVCLTFCIPNRDDSTAKKRKS